MDGGLAHLQCVGVSQAGRVPVLCSLIHDFFPTANIVQHTHIWHKLAHLTIPLDSQSAINLKQTKIDRYCVSTTEEIMLTFHNESLHQAEYNLMYNQSPFEFQECTNSNIPKGAGKTH